MNRLIFIASCMLTYHISTIVVGQTLYLYVLYLNGQQPEFYNDERNDIVNNTGSFFDISSFIIAHWIFAYDYWKVAHKLKLQNQNLP